MKLLFRILCFLIIVLSSQFSSAQCTTASLNWDNLDYYYNSNNTAPYATYISTTQAATQKFAIGTTYVTIATPAAVQTFVNGENATHTVPVTVGGINYSGDNAQFTPSADGQQIKITFAQEVQDVSFTLYDIDLSAKFNITANDALGLIPKIINATLQGTTILNTGTPISTNNTANLTLTASNTTAANNANTGTATISISGAVKDVTITVTTKGTDAAFWLSDIYACVPGTFPLNYHQMAENRPYTGQPSYFITTPDNNYFYMVDPATGKATALFQDPENMFVNSAAYDAVNHLLYYVTDGSKVTGSPIQTAPSVNKKLKKYDFNTGAISVVVPDLSSLLGFPTFDAGVESGGASFYDGALYLGIEGGRYDPNNASIPRESIIYKIEFDASTLAASNAYQVWATPAYNLTANAPNPTSNAVSNTVGATSIHDWGDFMIKDGIIYDFNTARTQSGGSYIYPNSSVYQVNMMTGVQAVVWNPSQSLTTTGGSPSKPYVGQVSLDWAGNLYSVRDGVQTYNTSTNALGTNTLIAAAGGSPIWVGNAGDATEPFRPKVDMGDAPASYDPDPLAPALHDFAENTVRLGATLDREWTKTSSTNADADGSDEDGVATPSVFINGSNYTVTVQVFNNPVRTTTTDSITATVAAWVDFNRNGVFDATEGVTQDVPKSASMQTITLTWPVNSFSLPANTNTYMRVRVSSKISALPATNLTAAKPTGYMWNGEVEDYYVLVNPRVLAVQKIAFKAQKETNRVRVNWNITTNGTNEVAKYIVARSVDKINWNAVTEVSAEKGNSYLVYDNNPQHGRSYYRLQVVERSGKSTYSDVSEVDFDQYEFEVGLSPNPGTDNITVSIYTPLKAKASIRLMNQQGILLSTENIVLQTGYTTRRIPADRLPSGTYYFELQQGIFLDRKKILVVH